MPVVAPLPAGPFVVHQGTPPADMARIVAFLAEKGLATDAELLAYGASRYAQVYPVAPSGDTTGATDRLAINAAITTAAAGGTVVLGRGGPWYIDQKITVPSKVNLWGQGDGEMEAATRIICTTAAAGIAFGTRTTGGRGGVSGNFTVDGNSKLATQPLFIGLTVQRTFLALEVTASAGDGLVMEASQNNTFIGFHGSHNALAAVAFDYGAAGNRFYNAELDSSGTWFIHFRQTGVSQADLSPQPFDNHFYGGIAERVASQGCVRNQAGDGNGVHDMQLVNDSNQPAFVHVKVDAGFLIVDGGLIQANIAGQGIAVQVLAGATLLVKGEPTIASVSKVFDNLGSVDVDGLLRTVGTIATYLTGNRPRELIPYGAAGLASQPIISAGVTGLGTTLGTIGGSWWMLNPASWTVPPGRQLQFRVHVVGIDLTAGDVLSATLISVTDGSVGLLAEFTGTAITGGQATAVSPWQSFPTAPKAGYLQTRNVTGARGITVSAFIEVRIG